MSFLNTFIELSILDETESQNAELEYQSRLLKKQNDLLEEQNEGINSLIRHNQQQDWIRDYLYRVNKLCERLENSTDKDSIQYYYSIYCLSKGINDSGVNTSAISELRDKEYFDNCLNRIGKLLYDFVQNHKDKITEYNEHVRNLEEAPVLDRLIECEKAKSNIHIINEKINKDNKKALKHSFIIGSIVFILIFILGLIFFGKYGIADILPIVFVLSVFVSFPLGAIFYFHNTENKDTELYKQRKNYQNLLSENPTCYIYAKDNFKNFDFTDKENTSEEILSTLEKRRGEIKISLDYCNNLSNDIFGTFYCIE